MSEILKANLRRVTVGAIHKCCDKDGIYKGKTGAKKFAREIGVALAKSGNHCRNYISHTYELICVPAYKGKPPISNGVWIWEVAGGYETKYNDIHNLARSGFPMTSKSIRRKAQLKKRMEENKDVS